MPRVLGILTVLVLAGLTAACGDGSGAPPAFGTASDLVGRTFVSTTVTGAPIPGDGPLIMEFPEPGRIAATAGCNHAIGAVDLAEGIVTAGDLAMTLMACPPPRDGADRWLSALFASHPRWSLDGDVLTLDRGAGSISLTDKKVVDPDRPLIGTEWALTSLRTASAIVTPGTQAQTPTLTVAEDGAVYGSTGCNRFRGHAQITDTAITFGPLATTRAACPNPESADVERHVLGVLAGETTYAIDAATLTVTAADGITGIEFTAS
ncbi:META domain-containing protein [Rhodococcus chondri]|uniref:META domain-containing protein n=1 Tax=Rhodococcus chondri TaxID=3065941 RepID=A0ABU7JNA1_9NOCA|nr:META domain-containing protein [Rhodococcus sp. CC-R104]MEE2031192.1 META domain-containing protein [Rhodococcus sp. CC-R104]